MLSQEKQDDNADSLKKNKEKISTMKLIKKMLLFMNLRKK